jgi:hypothetical protein
MAQARAGRDIGHLDKFSLTDFKFSISIFVDWPLRAML